jgi:hypothetical protein
MMISIDCALAGLWFWVLSPERAAPGMKARAKGMFSTNRIFIARANK